MGVYEINYLLEFYCPAFLFAKWYLLLSSWLLWNEKKIWHYNALVFLVINGMINLPDNIFVYQLKQILESLI